MLRGRASPLTPTNIQNYEFPDSITSASYDVRHFATLKSFEALTDYDVLSELKKQNRARRLLETPTIIKFDRNEMTMWIKSIQEHITSVKWNLVRDGKALVYPDLPESLLVFYTLPIDKRQAHEAYVLAAQSDNHCTAILNAYNFFTQQPFNSSLKAATGSEAYILNVAGREKEKVKDTRDNTSWSQIMRSSELNYGPLKEYLVEIQRFCKRAEASIINNDGVRPTAEEMREITRKCRLVLDMNQDYAPDMSVRTNTAVYEWTAGKVLWLDQICMQQQWLEYNPTLVRDIWDPPFQGQTISATKMSLNAQQKVLWEDLGPNWNSARFQQSASSVNLSQLIEEPPSIKVSRTSIRQESKTPSERAPSFSELPIEIEPRSFKFQQSASSVNLSQLIEEPPSIKVSRTSIRQESKTPSERAPSFSELPIEIEPKSIKQFAEIPKSMLDESSQADYAIPTKEEACSTQSMPVLKIEEPAPYPVTTTTTTSTTEMPAYPVVQSPPEPVQKVFETPKIIRQEPSPFVQPPRLHDLTDDSVHFCEIVIKRGGRICFVTDNHLAESSRQLTVNTGDVVELLDDADEVWWTVRNETGYRGDVPKWKLEQFSMRKSKAHNYAAGQITPYGMMPWTQQMPYAPYAPQVAAVMMPVLIYTAASPAPFASPMMSPFGVYGMPTMMTNYSPYMSSAQ